MQHSQDEKGTDRIALLTAFIIFPFCAAVAGWLFGPLSYRPNQDPYGTIVGLERSVMGAGIGALAALLISGFLMLIRRVWHHTNPPAGYEESPEP
jgi:hypothetical protein